MTITTNRRLHVWEHHSLHPEAVKGGKYIPVHVVFEHDEFDWWRIDSNTGAFVVGWFFERPEQENGAPARTESVPFYSLSSGMFAKTWLECYDIDDSPKPYQEPEIPADTPLFDGEASAPNPDLSPAIARDVLTKKFDLSESKARERFNTKENPILLDIADSPADNTATSVMLPPPPRSEGEIETKLAGGQTMKLILPPQPLDQTRMDLKPLLDLNKDSE